MNQLPLHFLVTFSNHVLEEDIIIDREYGSVATKVIDDNEYSLKGTVLIVDKNGKCYLELDNLQLSSKTRKCNMTCKKLCAKDKQTIIKFKSVFTDESVEAIRDLLQTLDDGCEHGHYSKCCDVAMKESSKSCDFNLCKELKGHSLPCSSDCCNSLAGYVYFELAQCTIQV